MNSGGEIPRALPARLQSLDLFRGLTMAAMVVVNNPGDWENVYWPLMHAEWHGWTPTDLVFPFFLFMVGITAALPGSPTSWRRIVRRTALLIALGLLLGAFPFDRLAAIRIPGVLQRIGICYFAAAVILRWTSSRSALLSIASALTLGYWMLLMWAGAGDLSPGSNLAARIDRVLLEGHLWKPDWDPEGPLSTLPAIATTLLGAVAGMYLQSSTRTQLMNWGMAPGAAMHRRPNAGPTHKMGSSALRLVTMLLAGGAAGIAAGLAWNVVFPINKNLWSSSYVFFTAGMAAVILAACFALVDGWPSRVGRVLALPFIVLGTNAILLYVLSTLIARVLDVVVVGGLTAKMRIYDAWFAPLASPPNASLLFAIAYLALMWIALIPFYRRRVFLRL